MKAEGTAEDLDSDHVRNECLKARTIGLVQLHTPEVTVGYRKQPRNPENIYSWYLLHTLDKNQLLLISRNASNPEDLGVSVVRSIWNSRSLETRHFFLTLTVVR